MINELLKTFLSMSLAGSLLISIFFIGKLFLKHKVSRQWQYYIWLIVIVRLLLPFAPKTNLMENLFQIVDHAIDQNNLEQTSKQIQTNLYYTSTPPSVESEQEETNQEKIFSIHSQSKKTSFLCL